MKNFDLLKNTYVEHQTHEMFVDLNSQQDFKSYEMFVYTNKLFE